MKRISRWIALCAGVVVLAVIVFSSVRRVRGAGQEQAESAGKEQSQPEKKPVTDKSGDPIVYLKQESLAMSGVRTALLARTSGQSESQVVAVVLSPQELLDLRTSYIAAAVQVEKARANENASRLEYRRLSQLNNEDKNASDKAVQAAEATFRSDTATLHNAEQALELAAIPARQRWGPVVSKWVADDSSSLKDFLEGRRLLLQVTLPAGTVATRRLLVQAGQRTTEAILLSAIPRVDPRFQTPSYLYETQAARELVPGMNVAAFAPEGSPQQGVLLPQESVLHWQGKNWVYIETEPGAFVRKEVSLDTPLRDGWLIRQGLMPGNHVVITGAQQLLSEEFRSQTQAIGKGDTD